VTPAGWRPDLRDRFAEEFKLPKDTQRIDAANALCLADRRTKTDGPPDYDAVHKIQAGYKVTVLSEFGKTPKPVEFKPDPSIDMKTPPKSRSIPCRLVCISPTQQSCSSFTRLTSPMTDHRADEENWVSSPARARHRQARSGRAE